MNATVDSGVVVAEVNPGGMAAAAGVRPGMVVLRVGKKSIRNISEFQEALSADSLDDGVMLLVRTGEGNRFIVLRAP